MRTSIVLASVFVASAAFAETPPTITVDGMVRIAHEGDIIGQPHAREHRCRPDVFDPDTGQLVRKAKCIDYCPPGEVAIQEGITISETPDCRIRIDKVEPIDGDTEPPTPEQMYPGGPGWSSSGPDYFEGEQPPPPGAAALLGQGH